MCLIYWVFTNKFVLRYLNLPTLFAFDNFDMIVIKKTNKNQKSNLEYFFFFIRNKIF